MNTVRNIKSSDLLFISGIIRQYQPIFINYYHVIEKMLIRYNNTLISTLVSENDDNIITGFDINIIKPYEFWMNIYKNLSFMEKYTYIKENKIYNKSHISLSDIPDIYNNIINNLYTKYNRNTAYTLFYYADSKIKNNTIKGYELGILNMKNLYEKDILFQTAEIKLDNLASIKSYSKRGFNQTKFYAVTDNHLFAVIDVNNLYSLINKYIVNAEFPPPHNFKQLKYNPAVAVIILLLLSSSFFSGGKYE